MGKVVGIVIAALAVWGSLANIMPDTFQLRHNSRAMALVFGKKTIWVAAMASGILIGWYIWNLETRLSALGSTAAHLVSSDDPTGIIPLGWTADNDGCKIQIDSSRLPVEMQQKFDFAIACGFSDPKIDQMKDDRITVSQLFSFQPSLVIAAVFGGTMAAALEKDRQLAIQEINPRPPRGANIQVTNVVWIRILLLPKGFNTGLIHTLSDVSANGGIIAQRGGGVNIVKVMTVN